MGRGPLGAGALPRGVALSTRIMRPSRLAPFMPAIARSASSWVPISTKPNPRERWVSRSVMTIADCTMP